jgi:hypothetical protein
MNRVVMHCVVPPSLPQARLPPNTKSPVLSSELRMKSRKLCTRGRCGWVVVPQRRCLRWRANRELAIAVDERILRIVGRVQVRGGLCYACASDKTT